MILQNATWGLMGPSAFSPGRAGNLAMAVNSVGVPYIAYCDMGAVNYFPKIFVIKAAFDP
jgi:hypothetical protein